MNLILKSFFGVAFMLALASPASGVSTVIQLLPSDIGDTPVLVRAENTGSGQHYTVLWTNDPTLDKSLHATLEVRDEDHQIAQCKIEKHWTNGVVEFSFDVATAYVEASKFTIVEYVHFGRQSMPALDMYWFYLRDFVTNRAPVAVPSSNDIVSPEILKKLPGRIKKLRPGAKDDQIWKQLGLADYQHSLSGGSYGYNSDRFWLSSNQELELVFEDTPNRRAGERKLIRVVLYKNGREIAASSK